MSNSILMHTDCKRFKYIQSGLNINIKNSTAQLSMVMALLMILIAPPTTHEIHQCFCPLVLAFHTLTSTANIKASLWNSQSGKATYQVCSSCNSCFLAIMFANVCNQNVYKNNIYCILTSH